MAKMGKRGSGIALAQITARLLDKNLRNNYFKNFDTAQFYFGDYDIEFVGSRK